MAGRQFPIERAFFIKKKSDIYSDFGALAENNNEYEVAGGYYYTAADLISRIFHNDSQQLFLTAAKMFHKAGALSKEASSYYDAAYCRESEDPQKALQFYNKAGHIFESLGMVEQTCTSYFAGINSAKAVSKTLAESQAKLFNEAFTPFMLKALQEKSKGMDISQGFLQKLAKVVPTTIDFTLLGERKDVGQYLVVSNSDEARLCLYSQLVFTRMHHAAYNFDIYMPQETRARDMPKSSLSRTQEVSEKWLTRAFLGDSVYNSFVRKPPFILMSDQYFFQLNSIERGAPAGSRSGAVAQYLTFTNMFAMRSTFKSTSQLMEVSAHEQLHYASWLGGGEYQRYYSGGKEHQFRSNWLNEGLTELHAQQLAQEHDVKPDAIAYPAETTVALYMQKIVGADVLKSAYLKGDFTDVMRKFDAALGEGSFLQLKSATTGLDACTRLGNMMEKKSIDPNQWSEDPLMVFIMKPEKEEEAGIV